MKICNKSLVLLLALFTLAVLTSGCATTTIPDFRSHITLPASEDGYYVASVFNGVKAHDEGRIPKDVWAELRKRGLILLPDGWAVLRRFLLENCLTNRCKLMVGTFDDLFMKLDTALKNLPLK